MPLNRRVRRPTPAAYICKNRLCKVANRCGSASGKPRLIKRVEPWLTEWRTTSNASGASPCSTRTAFSASTISGAVSSNVPSRSNRIARSGEAMSAGARAGFGSAEMRQIVHVGIRRQAECPGQGVVRDAAQVDEFEAGGSSPSRELGGADEFQVFMRAARQNLRNVFGPENRHRERLRMAIQCRYDDVARRLRQSGERLKRRGRIRYMLQHFHASDGIERAVPLAGEILHGRRSISDGDFRLQRVQFGDLDQGGGQVDSEHARTGCLLYTS